MTTVLFVHGTGVRKAHYEETFELIQQTLLKERPDLKVEPCLWGDDLGAKLKADGASIPLYDETLAPDEGEKEDYQIVLWQQLYRDPLYELRLLSLKPVDESAVSPFEEQPGDELRSRLARLSPSRQLQADRI